MEKFAQQTIKTGGFEKMTAFEMSLTKLIQEAMQTKKNFRMVLEYDAEALNVSVSFEEAGQESTEDFLARLKEEFRSPEHKKFIARYLNRIRAASYDTSPEDTGKS